VKHGDRYEIDGSILMCGDSTVEADMLKLMEGAKADMVMTDPPYILDYLKGKTKNKRTASPKALERRRTVCIHRH
jgi:DNA modification methylase